MLPTPDRMLKLPNSPVLKQTFLENPFPVCEEGAGKGAQN